MDEIYVSIRKISANINLFFGYPYFSEEKQIKKLDTRNIQNKSQIL